uniref:Uncharacterized protein n=1 Tax=Globodera rostochiensis TaxID=31243 RepID=A0A914H477_GLORO
MAKTFDTIKIALTKRRRGSTVMPIVNSGQHQVAIIPFVKQRPFVKRDDTTIDSNNVRTMMSAITIGNTELG